MIDVTKLKSAEETSIDAKHVDANNNLEAPTIMLASMGQGDQLPVEDLGELEVVPQPTRPQPTVITEKALGEKQYRFSITPLYTRNYKYADPTEFMIDEYTGVGAVKLGDGNIVSVQENGRLRYHMMQFESDLSYYGMRNSIIKSIIYEDDSHVHSVTAGFNILDGSIYIDEQAYINRMCISVDFDILEKSSITPRLQNSHVDPVISITYRVDRGERHQYSCKLSELRLTSETMHTISIEIEDISIQTERNDPVSDCLILVHSILVAVTEEQ